MEIYIVILAVIIVVIAGYEFISKTKTIKELNEKNKDLELKTQELYAQLNEAEKEKVKIEAENKLQKQTQEQQKIIFDNMQKIAPMDRNVIIERQKNGVMTKADAAEPVAKKKFLGIL